MSEHILRVRRDADRLQALRKWTWGAPVDDLTIAETWRATLECVDRKECTGWSWYEGCPVIAFGDWDFPDGVPTCRDGAWRVWAEWDDNLVFLSLLGEVEE